VYPLKSLTRELTSAAMFTKKELSFFFFTTAATTAKKTRRMGDLC
jgi:hypothetical protein